MKKNLFLNFGFTLIELLVVISLIGILFGFGVAQYVQFNRRQVVEQTALDLKNNLRLAQTQALGGNKPVGCSFLLGYKVVFFQGSVENNTPDGYLIKAICSEGEIGEKRFTFPLVVRFSPLPSPPSVVFKVLGHGTDLENELEIKLKGFNNDSYIKTVIITSSGEIR
ncbi:MAG: pilus assembly FimT family protein [Microgenomates group bacterium]